MCVYTSVLSVVQDCSSVKVCFCISYQLCSPRLQSRSVKVCVYISVLSRVVQDCSPKV